MFKNVELYELHLISRFEEIPNNNKKYDNSPLSLDGKSMHRQSNFHINIFVMLVLQCCSAERTKQVRADPLYLEEDTERQKRE